MIYRETKDLIKSIKRLSKLVKQLTGCKRQEDVVKVTALVAVYTCDVVMRIKFIKAKAKFMIDLLIPPLKIFDGEKYIIAPMLKSFRSGGFSNGVKTQLFLPDPEKVIRC